MAQDRSSHGAHRSDGFEHEAAFKPSEQHDWKAASGGARSRSGSNYGDWTPERRLERQDTSYEFQQLGWAPGDEDVSPSSHPGDWNGSADSSRDSMAADAEDPRDREYLQWRDDHARTLDDDYRLWQDERYQRFVDEFSDWRSQRTRPRSENDGGE